eukprot:5850155-Pleurochrysis_carterae.AAC.1
MVSRTSEQKRRPATHAQAAVNVADIAMRRAGAAAVVGGEYKSLLYLVGIRHEVPRDGSFVGAGACVTGADKLLCLLVETGSRPAACAPRGERRARFNDGRVARARA